MKLRGILCLDRRERKLAGVVNPDATADGAEQHHVAGLIVNAFWQGGVGLQKCVLAWLKNAVETAHYHEGQDHLAVFGLLEVASQRLGDLPDEICEALRLLGCPVVHSDPCFLALVSRAVAKDRAPARQNAKRQTRVIICE